MDSTDSKVSIITVSKNSAKTIEQTIQSVLLQTYQNIEYIVIDGASSDGTQQIIERYTKHISIYISEEDNGLYDAMNKGLHFASGDIIGIINSDDWYEDTAVENMVAFFKQSEADLVYGLITVVSENGPEYIKSNAPLETIWYQIPFYHPSVFVKKKVYDKFGGFNANYTIAADYDLLLRFYSEKIKFAFLNKVIAHFRIGGLSSTFRKRGCEENYKITMSYVDKCPYKESILPKIQENYVWSCFSVELQTTNGLLRKLLRAYFNENITTISIFGTGIWAGRCYRNLMGSGVEIQYFSDNDMTKWGTLFEGIEIVTPQKLKQIDVLVLIAVREAGDSIKHQLQNMEGGNINCVTIRELRQIFSSYNDEEK